LRIKEQETRLTLHEHDDDDGDDDDDDDNNDDAEYKVFLLAVFNYERITDRRLGVYPVF
jgi:hypothetical protein